MPSSVLRRRSRGVQHPSARHPVRCGLLIAAIATLTAIATSGGAADRELVLTSGERVRGEVIADSEESVTLKRRLLRKGVVTTFEVTYERARIATSSAVPTPLEEYAARAAKVEDVFEAQIDLAQWSLNQCLLPQAEIHARKAVELDPTNPWLNQVMAQLGFIQVKDEWVKESEYLARNGLAKWGERTIPMAELEPRRQLARALHERNSAAQTVKELEYTVANATADKLDELGKKVEQLKRTVEQSRKQNEDLERRQQAIQERMERANDNRNSRNSRRTAAQQEADRKALQEAQKARSEADTRAREAASELASSQRKLNFGKAGAKQAGEALPKARERLANALVLVETAVKLLPGEASAEMLAAMPLPEDKDKAPKKP